MDLLFWQKRRHKAMKRIIYPLSVRGAVARMASLPNRRTSEARAASFLQ